MFYLNFALAILLIKSYESIIIETTNDQTDQQCDFYNETLIDKVWFVRSPYNCRVYHLCAFYKQFTLTCAEGLFFDENIDSCNFESLVNCQLNNNNIEFYNSKNNQSDVSNTNYYYNIDDSAYLDKNSNENSSDEDASEKSGDYATIWPEIEKIILSTLTSTSIPTTITSTTTSTSTSTTTTTETISTTTMNSITAKATQPTHWYNNPFSPVTFLLFTYQNNKNYSSSKKYSDILPDKKNIFYNLKSSNYSNSYIVLNQNQQKQQNEHEKSSFSLPSLFEESNEQKDNNKLYDFSSAYNKNLNKEINKFFDSLIQNTTIAATTSSTSSRNLKIDLNKNNDSKMDPWWLAPKKCMPGFEHKMIHRENCALYYECNSNGTQTEKACPYPLLFDEFSNSCKPYEIVNCGKRKEAKHLCDYELNTSNNKNNTPKIKKCSSYPNCKNLADGLYPTDNCRNYFQCKNERTLRILSCPFDHERNQTLRFNIMTRRCDFIENVPMNCGGYSIQIDIYTGKMKCPIMRSSTLDLSYELKDIYYKHPTKCNLFIECDKENMTILECPDGTHFSPIYQSCVHPTISNCNPLFSSSLSSSTSISQLSNFDNDEMPNVDKSIASQTNTKLDDSINFNASFEANYSNEDLNDSNQEDDYNEDENNNNENDESKSSAFIDTTSTKIIKNTDSVTISKSKHKTISTISILNENTDDSILPHLNDNFTYIYTTTTTEINKLENDNVIINNSTQVF